MALTHVMQGGGVVVRPRAACQLAGQLLEYRQGLLGAFLSIQAASPPRSADPGTPRCADEGTTSNSANASAQTKLTVVGAMTFQSETLNGM